MSKTLQESDVKQLNSFLRGEISAVETFEQALKKVDDSFTTQVLRECKASHELRVNLLRSEIRKLGGEPAEGSGVWGAFAKAIEGGAKLFGDSAAVAALEEGEDHGLKDYRDDLEDLSIGARSFVASHLLPEQVKSHAALSRLKEHQN